MNTSNILKITKSTLTLLFILNFIFLPCSSFLFSLTQNYNWIYPTIYLFTEQFFLLSFLHTPLLAALFNTISVSAVHANLHLSKSPYIDITSQKGVLNGIFLQVVFEAAMNVGMIVTASKVSCLFPSSRNQVIGVAALGCLVACKVGLVYVTPETSPVVAMFKGWSWEEKYGFYIFCGIRIWVSALLHSLVVGIRKNGDVRMRFQRMVDREYIRRLFPQEEEEEEVQGKGGSMNLCFNLHVGLLALWLGIYLAVNVTRMLSAGLTGGFFMVRKLVWGY